jgi:hypothetical protein
MKHLQEQDKLPGTPCKTKAVFRPGTDEKINYEHH